MERVVAIRLNDHIAENDLLPRFQFAYRKRHSTETAMLRVWSDILTAADQRHVTLLGLLAMSAAFDCVDHDLLIQRLQLGFGLTGAVLEWICSFLQGRTQQVLYNGRPTTVQQLLSGAVLRWGRGARGTTRPPHAPSFTCCCPQIQKLADVISEVPNAPKSKFSGLRPGPR